MMGLIAFHNSKFKEKNKMLSGERFDVLTIDVFKLSNCSRIIVLPELSLANNKLAI